MQRSELRGGSLRVSGTSEKERTSEGGRGGGGREVVVEVIVAEVLRWLAWGRMCQDSKGRGSLEAFGANGVNPCRTTR